MLRNVVRSERYCSYDCLKNDYTKVVKYSNSIGPVELFIIIRANRELMRCIKHSWRNSTRVAKKNNPNRQRHSLSAPRTTLQESTNSSANQT